jgi:hypothetical protein
MPFPPNYNQERNNRARDKQRKAEAKLAKREEKTALRKRQDDQGEPSGQPASDEQKD